MCSAKKYHLFYYSFTRFCWISLRSEFNHIEKSLVYHILFYAIKMKLQNWKIFFLSRGPKTGSVFKRMYKHDIFFKKKCSTIVIILSHSKVSAEGEVLHPFSPQLNHRRVFREKLVFFSQFCKLKDVNEWR